MCQAMTQISSPATPALVLHAPLARLRAEFVRYAPAVVWSAGALAVAVLLRSSTDPTTVFLVAVAGATWSGGWRTGLLAAALATLAVDYFFVPPMYSLVVAVDQLPRLGFFVLCAAAVSWASDARRVSVDRALKESERQFHAVFEDAAVGIALVNASGHAFRTNRQLRRVFGYTDEEFRSFPFTKVTHPAEGEADWNLFTELAHGTRDSYRLDKRCFAKDGRPVCATLGVSLVRDEHAQPLFGIVVVTEQAKA
jgi:PAS domain S-box-containing protein